MPDNHVVCRGERGRFMPEYSGNPKERPSGASLRRLLSDALQQPPNHEMIMPHPEAVDRTEVFVR